MSLGKVVDLTHDLSCVAEWQAHVAPAVCPMQVYRACQRGYWRASKRWCKQLPQDAVDKALCRFANNESGLCPQVSGELTSVSSCQVEPSSGSAYMQLKEQPLYDVAKAALLCKD